MTEHVLCIRCLALQQPFGGDSIIIHASHIREMGFRVVKEWSQALRVGT